MNKIIIIVIILILAMITLALILADCYELFLIYASRKSRFFALQFVAIYRREDWRYYKMLKKNPDQYQVFYEDHLNDEFLHPSTPYYILVCRSGKMGCFATAENECLLANAGGEQFLIEELINIKEGK